jgi:hypothetical protein
MTTNLRTRLICVLGPIAVGLAAPSSIIFFLAVFVGHIEPLAEIRDILQRQFAPGHNLFLIALFGLIPFLALSAVCFFASLRLPAKRLACVGIGGLVGILILMVPGHISVWHPLYAGGHESSTAVIAFAIIPFFCLVTLVIGLVVGWAVSLLPIFRQ